VGEPNYNLEIKVDKPCDKNFETKLKL